MSEPAAARASAGGLASLLQGDLVASLAAHSFLAMAAAEPPEHGASAERIAGIMNSQAKS
eukprot:627202-Pyramimonas_sp.AAC.1